MNDDLSAIGRGIKRIEQQVRHGLYNFTSEGQNRSIRLKALMNNNSLSFSLRAVKFRYFAEYRTHFEYCRFVAVTMKLEGLSSNATQTLQLFF